MSLAVVKARRIFLRSPTPSYGTIIKSGGLALVSGQAKTRGNFIRNVFTYFLVSWHGGKYQPRRSNFLPCALIGEGEFIQIE
jgi:hypothetical protein